ncbi:MAG: LpxL/LpxP family Kdo(2)-lipid IV(A) lauroyl/palmitoleoyl acyltransferase [Gammaproteobacteria bacterium]|nr:LpxL/LpxP family Kdo(2)-lipid IV(A) lauroyl/palmitoleoyl acyltransferase [Gammaproteobacteria bacterium]MCP5423554.1 LpxL/LpxP family Kdo(2)-lipid IV(A) lauroyl/palmitoleoyl acyltransferase [Gammaproteobacteria bacterium]
MSEQSLFRRYAAPRYWSAWFGVASGRLIAQFPFSWQLAIGGFLGRLFGFINRYRRHVVDVNLSLCFPELTEAQRHDLTKRHFAALGTAFFELATAWWGSDKKVRPLGRIEGLEHLQAAVARGKGVILLTGHFTTLEMGARFITFHQDFHAMYRPHKNPLYESFMRRERERRSGLAPLPRQDIRGMIRALRRGRVVWYAPDQGHGKKDSLFVPFFNVPALTLGATARLAKITGAAVVPYFPERLPGAAGYKVTILPALDDFPSEDIEADTLRINRLLESWIRQVPEQYLWVHRRFKKRPKNYPKVYRVKGRWFGFAD